MNFLRRNKTMKPKVKVVSQEKTKNPAVTYKMEELIPQVSASLIPSIELRDILNKIIDKLNKI
jgi:hypothetical protein